MKCPKCGKEMEHGVLIDSMGEPVEEDWYCPECNYQEVEEL